MPALPLNPDQLADAARLKALFKALQQTRADHGEPSSQEWASGKLGFNQSSLSQYLNGKIPLNPDAASKFALLLGCAVSTFSPALQKKLDSLSGASTDEGDPHSTTVHPSSNTKDWDVPTTNVAAAPPLRPSSRVPVVGQVKAGRDGYLEESAYEGEIEYWTGDRGAFALRVQGDSMHPRYRAGEFVIVSPNIEPLPHTDVVVTLKSGRKLLKQLNWIREDEIQLLSINGDYAPETLLRSEIESIQKVLGSVGADALLKSR